MSLNYENQSNVSLWMKSPAILLFVLIFLISGCTDNNPQIPNVILIIAEDMGLAQTF